MFQENGLIETAWVKPNATTPKRRTRMPSEAKTMRFMRSSLPVNLTPALYDGAWKRPYLYSKATISSTVSN